MAGGGGDHDHLLLAAVIAKKGMIFILGSASKSTAEQEWSFWI